VLFSDAKLPMKTEKTSGNHLVSVASTVHPQSTAVAVPDGAIMETGLQINFFRSAG